MKQWYVVQTKPRREAVAVENLERQGYTTYCPQLKQARYQRKRWQQTIEPLFPRYLFVQLSLGIDDFAPIRSTTGVLNLVRFGNHPATIPHQAIAAIQQQEQQLLGEAKNHPDWKPGDRVEIVAGPFAGLNGIFEKENDAERVIILLEMLGRSNRVTVDFDSLVPMSVVC